MAFTEGSEEGVLNGTSYVIVLQAPGASQRRVAKSLAVLNQDTGALTLQLFVNEGGTRRQFTQVTIQTYQTFIWSHPVILNSATKTLDARVTTAPAVSQPTYVTTYAEIT